MRKQYNSRLVQSGAISSAADVSLLFVASHRLKSNTEQQLPNVINTAISLLYDFMNTCIISTFCKISYRYKNMLWQNIL